ncbi:MAG: kynureninase [Bacteroidota bacterium]
MSTIEKARELDNQNPLSHFKNRFYPVQNTIYVDGNSLGLLSIDAEKSILRLIDEWKNQAISGWLNAQRPWFYFAEDMGAMASVIVGASKNEVIMTGTTTINIHNLISSFYNAEGKKCKILADELNFPSDLYAIKGFLRLIGSDINKNLIIVKSDKSGLLDEDTIVNMMSDEISLVFLPSVIYTTGQLLDIKKLTKEAHDRNILIGFDCSHSVGAIPHKFSEWDVDFATWCSYKYLNGGPGGAAFIYVNQKHFEKVPYLTGWFGSHKDIQFDMSPEFIPAPDVGRWQISSPGVLGSVAIEGSLKIILEAGIENIRVQSLKLTDYLIFLIKNRLIKEFPEFKFATPLNPDRRGGHISIEHPVATRIVEAMKESGIIPDLRPPNLIRIAPVALYNTFEEVWKVVDIMLEIMRKKAYLKFSNARKIVS